MIVTIDRLEGAFAVVEFPDGHTENLPLSQLPQGIHEGNKLEQTESGWFPRPDLEETSLAANRARLARLIGRKKE